MNKSLLLVTVILTAVSLSCTPKYTQPELVVELVKEGRVTEERINQAASRILQWHFILGLFENPYVDPEKALQTLQKPEYEAFGLHPPRHPAWIPSTPRNRPSPSASALATSLSNTLFHPRLRTHV